ncbi:hypothetical protein BJ741DRAFT_659502 [Chytriomyces cf. hyalinus JEL632]|nr:hypothetical protein BJ741DRAFT_659502 [Chytriomyces cf. hyalinus JEL632]
MRLSPHSLLLILSALIASVLAGTASKDHGDSLAAKDLTTLVKFGSVVFQCKDKNVRIDKSTGRKFVFPSGKAKRTCESETNSALKSLLDLKSVCPSNKDHLFHLFDPSKICTRCRSLNGKKCVPAQKPANQHKSTWLKRQTGGDISNGNCQIMDDGSYLCDYNEMDLWFLDKSAVVMNDFYFVADDIAETQTGQWEYYFFDAASYRSITNVTTLAGAKQSKHCWCGNTVPAMPGDRLTPATQCGFKFPCFTDLACDLYCEPNYDGKTVLMINFKRQDSDFIALPGEDSFYWYYAEAKDDNLDAYDPMEFEKDSVAITAAAVIKPTTTAAASSKSSATTRAMSMSIIAVICGYLLL